MPTTYNTSNTPLCGLSFPSSILPQSNFSGDVLPPHVPSTCVSPSPTDSPTPACCTSNISTSNACFQSCSPRGEWDTAFSECVYENLMNRSGSVEVWCNAVAQGYASGTAAGATARLGWMGFALLVVAGCSVLL